jgi:D-glycero-D-manno-heptose 1,7-bisphosphate phosphatase
MAETKRQKSETRNQNERGDSSLVTRHSSLVTVSGPGSLKERRRASLRPAVFLDRDGTISEEVGYVNHIDRLRLFPWTAPAVRKLNQAGMAVVVVTNQSGVGQGYFPEELVHRVHERIREELASQGAQVDAFYYCPHHPNARLAAYRKVCACRKPETGMLEQAAADLGLDLGLACASRSSYVIGDSARDIETGFKARARTVLVLTGYGKGNYEYRRAEWVNQPDWVAENLLEAVERIVAETSQGVRESRSLR